MMRLIDADELRRDGWVLHKMVGTTLHEMPLDYPDIPIVDAEPVRHGHWEFPHETTMLVSNCSLCGAFGRKELKYCPNCGAKMDEVEK